MDMKEKDPVLELFDVFRQVMEEVVEENKNNEEVTFRKQTAELGKSLWWFMDEMMKAGFSNKQAFALLQSIVIEGVQKNG